MSRWRSELNQDPADLGTEDPVTRGGDRFQFLVDTLAELPIQATTGDRAFVLADNSTWVRNGSNEWEEVAGAPGAHPDLATHDALGLATDAELATHAGAADPHTGYVQEAAHGSTAISGHTSVAKEGSSALTGAVTLSEGANVTLTQVGQDIEVAATGAAGAPSDADYLVGTANGGLSNEIVVGTSPAGELGGTWASPTVDATHAGSTHSTATDTHIADGTAAHAASAVSADSTTLVGTGTDVQAVLEELDNGIADHLADAAGAHAASAISIADAGGDFTATDVEGALDELQADNEAHVGAADPHTGYLKESDVAAKGDLYAATADNTVGVLTVGANDTILMADSGTATGLKWAAAATTTEIADVAEAEAAGTSDTYARGDHVHSGAAYQLESGLQAVKFSVGALLEGAPPSNGLRMVWRAPFACTVTNVRTHFDAGTNIVCNARVNQTSNFLSSNFTNSTANAWGDGGAVQNTAIAAGDDIEVNLVSTSGAVTKANIQVDLTRIIPS